MQTSDCTILVASCDKYSDLLAPFSVLWRKFWPDCPFETVLVTESKPSDPRLCFDRVIACGPGMNWASRLVKALGEIRTPYVLMLCDDYYLDSPVDTPRILKRFSEMRKYGAANLRMIPNPCGGRPFAEDLLEYEKQTAYCVATQAGFWAKDFLLKLAQPPVASIWEFERYGSFAVADETRPILHTATREFPFVDSVHKGCWEKAGLAVCRANGITPDLTKRGLPPPGVRLVETLKKLVFFLFPQTLIVRVQNRFSIGAKERAVQARDQRSSEARPSSCSQTVLL